MLSRVRNASIKADNQEEYKKTLLSDIKKNVKSLMELLAYRKLVNEDSGVVLSLCLSIEACVRHGLKRRTFDSFSNSDSYYNDLLTRLEQLGCASAAFVLSRLKALKSKKLAKSPVQKSPVSRMFSFGDVTSFKESGNAKLDNPSSTISWIRVALVEKHLQEILTFLIANANTLYHSHALFADSVLGPLVVSLLAGPCSVDYSHLRGSDIPSTSESSADVVARRKASSERTRHFSVAAFDLKGTEMNADGDNNDYVFTADGLKLDTGKFPELIFAKNNIAMESNDGSVAQQGYLTVYMVPTKSGGQEGALVRWQANDCIRQSHTESPSKKSVSKSTITIRLAEVSHIHCHRRPHSDSHATIVMIGLDGVQFPALMFKETASALSFLLCLDQAVPTGTTIEPAVSKSSFEIEESKDLVFQLIPSSPKYCEGSLKTSEKSSAKSAEGSAEEVENVVPDIKNMMKESKTEVNLISINEGRRITKSLSTSGISMELEAALAVATLAGAQYFDELGQSDRQPPPSRRPKCTGRLTTVCRSVQKQLLGRVFYGWFAYVRHVKTVRAQLTALVVNDDAASKAVRTKFFDETLIAMSCVTSLAKENFETLRVFYRKKPEVAKALLDRIIYLGGLADPNIRPNVWAVLLNLYQLGATDDEVNSFTVQNCDKYKALCMEWQRSEEKAESLAAQRQLNGSELTPLPQSTTTPSPSQQQQSQICSGEKKKKVHFTFSTVEKPPELPGKPDNRLRRTLSDSSAISNELESEVTKRRFSESDSSKLDRKNLSDLMISSTEEKDLDKLTNWLVNLHRIDKDVARCDRTLDFFRPCHPENLSALRRIVCSYVYENIDIGYIQGMCDIAAPILVVCKESNVGDSEAFAFALFSKLMQRLIPNFPSGNVGNVNCGPAAIDISLSRLRSLIQILDPELYEHLSDSPTDMDATHLYFAYRWLLLDFKREFNYSDVFRIWEAIWASDDVASPTFSLFIAFALIEIYRDVIVAENMDFTDIIKFFNDMAEKHDATMVLDLARQMVKRVQETSTASGPRSPAILH